jgi:GT2 family glycosyltransferase
MAKTFQASVGYSLKTTVDILIPYYENYVGVKNLISSLFSTVGIPYQITLIDDGSENMYFGENFTKIKPSPFLPEIKCIRNAKRLGFGACVNLGIKATSQPWIVVMHSDVEAQQNQWLINMMTSMNNLKSLGIKMVSAQSDNPVNGDPRLKASKIDVNDDITLSDDYLPFYTTLFHRQLINAVGALKEYPYAGYEDEEFASRLRKKKFKQAICGSSWVHHEGSVTIKAAPDSIQKIIFEENRNRCIADMHI